jgi:hypothetical protein
LEKISTSSRQHTHDLNVSPRNTLSMGSWKEFGSPISYTQKLESTETGIKSGVKSQQNLNVTHLLEHRKKNQDDYLIKKTTI